MEVKKHKYFLVFLITLGIFAVIYLASEFLYSQRISSVKAIEDTINRSILESEIQYSLLADATCGEEESNPILIDEINALAKRLDVMETQRGATDPEVISLKKYYSLLQVRDYLFLRERAKQCNEHPATVIYFYSNTGNCDDCKKMGFVLTSMREEFSALHIYAFDYNLDLSALRTMRSIYKVQATLPALVIDNKVYYGYKSQDDIEHIAPAILTFATTSSATSTRR
jgi:hypothetical protein